MAAGAAFYGISWPIAHAAFIAHADPVLDEPLPPVKESQGEVLGSGSGNLFELDGVLNKQAAKGYRLHTITTASAKSGGFGGGDRIQATMVFEKLSRGDGA